MITAEIANVVENRSRFWKIAHDIAEKSDIYGYRDVYEEIKLIGRQFKVEKNMELGDLTDNQIKELVQERLEGERVLGDQLNSRRRI